MTILGVVSSSGDINGFGFDIAIHDTGSGSLGQYVSWDAIYYMTPSYAIVF